MTKIMMMNFVLKLKQTAVGFFIFLTVTFLYPCPVNDNLRGKKMDTQEYIDDQRVMGEYIISIEEGVDQDIIYSLFADYKGLSLINIRSNIYLIKLENDPGPENLRIEYLDKEEIKDIQPNYKYSVNPPEKKIIKVEPAQ